MCVGALAMTLKLLFLDMEGVLFEPANLWLRCHEAYATLEEGKALTERYMHADYPRLVKEVVGRLWRGRDAAAYLKTVDSFAYNDGVEELFAHVRAKGVLTAIVSGSSMELARRAQRDYGIDFLFANDLIICDGVVSGEYVWAVGASAAKKAQVVRGLRGLLGLSREECVYVGDDAIDVEAFAEVATSIAFNAKVEALREVATYVVDSDSLAGVIPYLDR